MFALNQFIHLSTFAREASKLKGSKFAKKGTHKNTGTGQWSARQVLAEAIRDNGAHPHVLNPSKPIALYGDAYALAAQLDDLKPMPGVRKDTPIIISGVASSPWSPGDPGSAQWHKDLVHFLSCEFGTNLDSVIAHTDESRDHAHFFIKFPDFAPIKSIHPGLIAQSQEKKSGGNANACSNAYVLAMQSFQDRYNKSVALKYNQARIGPARLRVSRDQWMKQCALETKRKNEIKNLDKREEQLKIAAKQLNDSMEEVKKQKTILNEIFSYLSDKIIELIPNSLYSRFIAVFNKNITENDSRRTDRTVNTTFFANLNSRLESAKSAGVNLLKSPPKLAKQ
jgi:hypothetical protein